MFFFLSLDPQVDKHVVKMILEYCQLLTGFLTAIRRLNCRPRIGK